MENVEQQHHPVFARLALFTIVMICLVAVGNAAFAADDGYLSTLEEEASSKPNSATAAPESGNSYLEELSIEAEASASTSSGSGKNPAANTGRAKKDRAQLEQLLRSKTPTTYKFYTKLSAKDKAEVLKHFDNDLSDRRLSHIQKNIMDLYFKR